MEADYQEPFRFEVDMDAYGNKILWRVLDSFDALLCTCHNEIAAKETVERLNS